MTSSNERLHDLGVVEAAIRLRDGSTSSVELVETLLERIDAAKHLNAFITVDREGALEAARRKDAARSRGTIEGALHGVPLVVKDNTHVAGLPNTAGTNALRSFVPTAHAPVVASLIDAGAIVLGKTNLHELGRGLSGYNEAFFTQEPIGVRNPHDPTRSPGGSSSGTAAAVAARLAPGGLGTDTVGSIRIPAALTGIAGLRPTMGRYSSEGITPVAHSRDTAGPMARSVEDVASLDAVVSGSAPLEHASLDGLRLGLVRSYFFQELDADTEHVVERTIERLTEAGVTLVELELPELPAATQLASMPIVAFEGPDDLVGYSEKYGLSLTLEALAAQVASADVRRIFENVLLPRVIPRSSGDPRATYEQALHEFQPALLRLFENAFVEHRVDALVGPTTARVAVVQGPDACQGEVARAYSRNADTTAAAGLAGLTLFAGLGPTTRLPVGLSLDGLPWTDRRLLSIGMAVEALVRSDSAD